MNLNQVDLLTAASQKAVPYLNKKSTVLIPLINEFDGPDPEKESGSGVLLKLKSSNGYRYFILTAGHVLAHFGNVIHVGCLVADKFHNFNFIPKEIKYVYSEGDSADDYGFIEIPEVSAKNIDMGNREFLTINELEIIDFKDKSNMDSWYCFTGYPKFNSKKVKIGNAPGTGFSFLHGLSTLLGSEGAPKISEFESHLRGDSNLIDLWLNDRMMQVYPKQDPTLTELDYVGGMSGGGLYKLNYDGSTDNFEPTMMRLVAINTYHQISAGTRINDKPAGFLRGVSVRKHLELISKHYPDIQLG